MISIFLRSFGVQVTLAAAVLLSLVALLVPVQPANAATSFSPRSIGDCRDGYGKAYAIQLKTSVTEAASGQRYATAYMTMNLKWCSDGQRITYPTFSPPPAAAPTGLGNSTNLQRQVTGFNKGVIQPVAVGGGTTFYTTARWERTSKISIGGGFLGITGRATFNPADFGSRMNIVISPRNVVSCTGSSDGAPERCEYNY